jgi:molybdopterin-binding protein
MKISARNQLPAKVKAVELGAVNAIVTLELAGGQEVVASITKHAVEKRKLKKGRKAYAMIKSTSVMVGID